jgi:amino acid transporter
MTRADILGGRLRGSDHHGLPTLTALVVTGMIGSGVFTTSGYALESLGSPAWVLAAWGVAGIVALCGAIAFGALARELPASGGEYLFLSRRLHPCAGFLAGVVSLVFGFSAAVALAALACERYANPLLPPGVRLPAHGTATLVVLVCGLAHATIGRTAARANTALVVIKMLAIAALVVIGYATLASPAAAGRVAAAAPAVMARSSPSAGQFATAVMWIAFSYTGFNQAVYVASEARDPVRDVPRALLLGTVITTLTYLLLNDVMLRAAPPEALAGRAEVAAVAAAALGGPAFERGMRAAIALSTFSAVAGMMMAGPRVYACMAADGIFPRSLAGPSGIGRSSLLQTVLAVLLVHQSTILGLLGYLGVTLSLFSALTVATLWRNRPDGRRSADVAALLAATTYVAATLLLVGLMAAHEPRHLLAAAATIAGGIALWPLVRPRAILDP